MLEQQSLTRKIVLVWLMWNSFKLGWEFILGTKEKPSNKFYGIITLLIPFLPGIQWYASVKTVNHPFGKFLSSLLFPFFMIFFKVRSSFATDVMLITFRFSDW